ncbi:Glycosyltransferase family 69 protein [Mycena indigotica]|uniref:Glycosyltransferase family 69 protein n=1 Tax=Mycena indigotica TaxID=2126181 RepID=A0A8H6SIN4_9AGAR|nr:Glycosyltransferase family 69 protein [Mycena indigotica]KAF7298555.1 Glycosyltransferase family 69 protein [Mycena indigotica]
MHLLSAAHRSLLAAHAHHPHLTISTLSLVATATFYRLFFLLLLWRPRPEAFPESRTLFVTLLFALPTWGLAMCLAQSHCLWSSNRRKERVNGGYSLVPFNDREWGVDVKDPSCLIFGTNAFGSYMALFCVGLYLVATFSLPEDVQYGDVIRGARRSTVRRKEGHGSGEKIFIAALFHNNEEVIPHWTKEIMKVINYLGADNVFVSIVESYSKDASPALLRSFESRLSSQKIPHRILIQNTAVPRPAV